MVVVGWGCIFSKINDGITRQLRNYASPSPQHPLLHLEHKETVAAVYNGASAMHHYSPRRKPRAGGVPAADVPVLSAGCVRTSGPGYVANISCGWVVNIWKILIRIDCFEPKHCSVRNRTRTTALGVTYTMHANKHPIQSAPTRPHAPPRAPRAPKNPQRPKRTHAFSHSPYPFRVSGSRSQYHESHRTR